MPPVRHVALLSIAFVLPTVLAACGGDPATAGGANGCGEGAPSATAMQCTSIEQCGAGAANLNLPLPLASSIRSFSAMGREASSWRNARLLWMTF